MRAKLLRKVNEANGFVLYVGPTCFPDHEGEIAVVFLGLRAPSSNTKTGPMIQNYIFAATKDRPSKTKRRDAGIAACGECPLKDGMCYPREHAGDGVHQRWLAGHYPEVTIEEARKLLRGRFVRLGADGDPAMFAHLLPELETAGSLMILGYTHQWREFEGTEHAPLLKRMFMASVQSLEGALEAEAAGWRYYRISADAKDLRPNEVVCPADKSFWGQQKTACMFCGLCDGKLTDKDSRKHIVTTPSGSPNKITRLNKRLPLLVS